MFTKQELSIYRILIRKDSYESIEIILKEEKLPLPWIYRYIKKNQQVHAHKKS